MFAYLNEMRGALIRLQVQLCYPALQYTVYSCSFLQALQSIVVVFIFITQKGPNRRPVLDVGE
jgi:hypothetical protein